MNVELAEGLLAPHAMNATILAFATAMADCEAFPDTAILLDFLEKPWKWAEEYAAWVNADKPQADVPEWETFCDTIERLQAA